MPNFSYLERAVEILEVISSNLSESILCGLKFLEVSDIIGRNSFNTFSSREIKTGNSDSKPS